ADAGLTNGAFDAHFDSKEDLVASAVADQLCEQRERYGTQSVEEIVRGYLSPQHRDDTEGGCPSAALLDEIGRSSDAVKRAYTDGQLAIIDDAAARLAPDDPQSRRVQALTVFALMVGTLQLSRALADRQLANDVLDQGIHNALALLGNRSLPPNKRSESGPEGIRTPDLLNAIQTRSQLRHGPTAGKRQL